MKTVFRAGFPIALAAVVIASASFGAEGIWPAPRGNTPAGVTALPATTPVIKEIRWAPVETIRRENIRAPSLETRGEGSKGRKASGLLCVKGVLYLWVRNAGNSQLAWSADHGRTWTWAEWKFTNSFGCPTFLNFGRDYARNRDGFAYLYSPDSNDAYSVADRLVLARAPVNRIRERDAYEFFAGR